MTSALKTCFAVHNKEIKTSHHAFRVDKQQVSYAAKVHATEDKLAGRLGALSH